MFLKFLTVCSDWLSWNNNFARDLDKQKDVVPIFETNISGS